MLFYYADIKVYILMYITMCLNIITMNLSVLSISLTEHYAIIILPKILKYLFKIFDSMLTILLHTSFKA